MCGVYGVLPLVQRVKDSKGMVYLHFVYARRHQH